MQIMRIIVLAAVTLVCCSAMAQAASTDHDKFKKFIGKVAPPWNPGKYKTPCVCKDGGSYEKFGGALWHSWEAAGNEYALKVYCAVQLFDSSGNLSSVHRCYDFERLK